MKIKKIYTIILVATGWKQRLPPFMLVWGDILKEQLISLIGDKLDDLNVKIDDVYTDKEGSQTYLRVVIDADDMINLERVVKATKIIDPIVEKADLISDEYILDVYAKPKGDD